MFPSVGFAKKQGAVSHSTAEAEVISLDAGIRLEGLPALSLWSLVIDVFEPFQGRPTKPTPLSVAELLAMRRKSHDIFGYIDYVPPSLPIEDGRATLYALRF